MSGHFTPAQLAAVESLSRLWVDLEWCLIGAAALGCHLDMRWRKTADLDFVLAVSLARSPAGLQAQTGWTRNRTNEHEWHGPGPVRVDVIPAGLDLLEAGRLVWDNGHEMSLLGMRLALAHARPLSLAPDLSIRVAPLHVLALLKIVSYLDRPHARERDLEDLCYILDEYVPADADRRFADEVPPEMDFDSRPAFLLGLDLAPLLEQPEQAAAMEFIARMRGRGADTTRSRLIQKGPVRWRTGEDEADARFDAVVNAFEAGLQLGACRRS